MPYVIRNSKGQIVEIHDCQLHGDMVWVELDHPELSTYLKQSRNRQQALRNLADTDLNMMRVVEDLIDLLMSKQLLTFTELPVAVQEKLGSRKQLRTEMQSLTNLIGADDSIF